MWTWVNGHLVAFMLLSPIVAFLIVSAINARNLRRGRAGR